MRTVVKTDDADPARHLLPQRILPQGVPWSRQYGEAYHKREGLCRRLPSVSIGAQYGGIMGGAMGGAIDGGNGRCHQTSSYHASQTSPSAESSGITPQCVGLAASVGCGNGSLSNGGWGTCVCFFSCLFVHCYGPFHFIRRYKYCLKLGCLELL